MKSYAEVEKMLDIIVDNTPSELYRELSGGVILSEDVKLHPQSIPNRPLYILGEYHNDIMGRYIIIYFGSFNIVYGYLPDDRFFEKLRHTFAHELRHHVEQLAGVRDLDNFDAQRYGMYKLGVDIAEFHEPPIGGFE
ncbi:MAG: metallopeptidase family protein [Clostridia bacterium]|nr:metallopeptidase family protein [Clostridia bacterium]